MNFSLIIPPFLCTVEQNHEFFTSKCMGVRGLSSFLKDKGHNVQLIDAFMEGYFQSRKFVNGFVVGLDAKNIANRIDPDADIIGLSVPFCYIAPIAHEITEELRRRWPNKTIIMGGIYPSTQPELALTSQVDYIVVGEGEIPLEKIGAGVDPKDIQGIYSKDEINNDSFNPAEYLMDLDGLPSPDNDSIPLDMYTSYVPRKTQNISIYTSRGCPFDCYFCSVHQVNGYKYRLRSSENVIATIEEMVAKYHVNQINFEDDNFTVKKDRTIEILEGIIKINEKGHSVEWRAPNGLRIDTLDEEVISLFKRSNCVETNVALEHGDPEMLRLMNKKIDLDQAYQIFELFVKYEIPEICTFLLVGYPGETTERFENSIRYLEKVHKLRDDIIVWGYIVQPYPGTKLETHCIQEGLLDPDSNNYLKHVRIDHPEVTVRITTPDFDADEVIRRRNIVYQKFNPSSYACFQPTFKSKVRKLLPRRAYYEYRRIRDALLI